MAAIIPAVAVGVAVGEELPKFFDDAFDQLGAGEGIYLRDGQPSGIVAQIGQAVGRAYCRRYDSVSAQYEGDAGLRIEKACRPYLDDIGSPNGPTIGVPFAGGQCEVLYQFTVVGDGPTGQNGFGECLGSQPNSVPGQVWGPVGGLTRGANVCSGGSQPAAADWFITCWGSSSGPRLSGPVSILAAQSLYTASLTGISRVDGQPDDCGNPPPVVVTPDPIPGPELPPFRFNPSPDIDIDIDVTINPDGSFDFDIGTGPITVDPFGGGDEPGGEPSGNPAGGDGLPGDPTATNPPAFNGEPGDGGSDVDFGPPPEGKVWVGCIARFVPVGVGIIPGSGGANAAYSRVVGNLSLRFGSVRGTGRQVRSEWAEAFRPVTALQVTGAFVNSLPQTVVTIFPVAAIICPEPVCGGEDG